MLSFSCINLILLNKDLHTNVCSNNIFKNIYEKYSKSIHDFLYYKYGAQFNPNDKMQDAFIKLWENCKNVSPAKAKSYLFTVANNMALNEIKHQKIVLRHQKQTPKNYTVESPEFVMEQEQFLIQYQEALSRLTEEQRVAFALSKIEKKTHKEIAAQLGVTTKVVEYRIYSAFSKLKKELENFNIK